MRKLFLAFLIGVVSCNSIQTISSYCLFKTETTTTNKVNDEYVYETDSLKVSYHFWENKGVMEFSIYNNTNVPIYVDWKNSEFIVNSIGIHYWIDEQQVQTQSYSNIYYTPVGTTGDVNSSSTIYKPERITSIAPKSKIIVGRFRIIREDYHPTYNDTGKVYTEKNTPYSFRNYIVLSKTEDLKTPFYVDNSFYVRSIKLVRDGANYFSNESFYVQRYEPKGTPQSNVFK